MRAQDAEETPPPVKPSRGAVKLQFLPPPMDGTFSLGVYDAKGKLVRTLQHEAKPEAFTAALDGFITSWDGRDDSGASAGAGRYSARGFCVGDKVQAKLMPAETLASATPQPSPAAESPAPEASASPGISPAAAASPEASPPPAAAETLEAARDFFKIQMPDGKPFIPAEKIRVKLRLNPLTQDSAASAEVAVGFDERGSFVKLADGLELKRISDTPHLKWAAAARGPEPGSLIVFQGDGVSVQELAVTKLANMMAFDCGEFLYEPAK